MNKTLCLLTLLSCLAIGLTGCSDHKKNEKAKDNYSHHMHMHHEQLNITLPEDIPVFQPGSKTYENALYFAHAVSLYVRYNTSKNNENKVKHFYRKHLVEKGWEIDRERSTDKKIFVSKEGRFLSVRTFDMKLNDTMSTAYTINVVEPKM